MLTISNIRYAAKCKRVDIFHQTMALRASKFNCVLCRLHLKKKIISEINELTLVKFGDFCTSTKISFKKRKK